ncbi:uncharacterized protein LOC135692889 [Rhopilema esculentum]|uniref:uncharacterized protein LOC135692889 n=1 Tax=Rhopilema esculentum TaxID=499914 RepID=UPI0031E0860A
MNREDDVYSVKKRFLVFVDCCNKTGVDIASVILETLKKFDIPIADCQGRGYDNAANMSSKYNGAQTHTRSVNPLSLYSPCACHSLNLCRVDSAMSCTEAVTFFGMVQTVYNLYSCSSQRWKILQSNIGSSLHGLSRTRWTDRVASVHLFAAQLSGFRVALQQLLALNLTPKTTTDVNSAIRYVSSFVCVAMSAIWLKILVTIDQRNQVIQARKATIDIAVANFHSLVADLKGLREKWSQIVQESILVATAMNISAEFPTKRKRILKRYEAAYRINDLFSFLWQYLERTDEMAHNACIKFGAAYGNDISPVALEKEVLQIKTVHVANYEEKTLDPHSLLNPIAKINLEENFYNFCTALRIFCTLPVTVASAERSFSKLKLIKNFMRSTMTHDQC